MSRRSSKGIYDCLVLSNQEVARGIFLMQLLAPKIAAKVQPGQFVNILVHPLWNAKWQRQADQIVPMLRRPFSVCRVEPESFSISIIWKVVGAGTKALAACQAKDVLSVLGPLGEGYRLPRRNTTVALVGGGLGVAPLPILAAALSQKGIEFDVLLGARNHEELWIGPEMKLARATQISTDDGSAGHCGFVTDLLETWLQTPQQTKRMVYACGPMPMLQRVAQVCASQQVEAQVSVETMMGCGYGICMGCPIEPVQGVAQRGRYYLACLDGPVFNASDILYESAGH